MTINRPILLLDYDPRLQLPVAIHHIHSLQINRLVLPASPQEIAEETQAKAASAKLEWAAVWARARAAAARADERRAQRETIEAERRQKAEREAARLAAGQLRS